MRLLRSTRPTERAIDPGIEPFFFLVQEMRHTDSALNPIDWDAHKDMFAGERPAFGSPRKGRSKPRQVEHGEAVALIQWRDLQVCRWPDLELLYAIPNGGHRSKAVAGKLKAEGVKASVSDYHLPVARGGYIGLWIELKAPGGRATKGQSAWLEQMRAGGHCAHVCVGWEAARDVLVDYLGSGRTIVSVEARA